MENKNMDNRMKNRKKDEDEYESTEEHLQSVGFVSMDIAEIEDRANTLRKSYYCRGIRNTNFETTEIEYNG
jgi:hypothetical protein